ncbi:MG2 domain-containing protein [Winogradskyella sp.]|nr:MG2 domain-containing protein [Winogradskyella sp.]
MKNYISLLMIICFANFTNAQDDFNNQWKAIEKFEQEGLTKSAADQVDVIYTNALLQNNKQQRIKALLYKSKYLLTLEEDAQLKIVNLFISEIETSKDIVTKHVLENMLATMYWQYFQQNRYQFYNRTKTTTKVNDDFRTWDLETLFEEIHTHFQRSLQNGLLLQQEPISNYKTLLVTFINSKNYRPTLYDLLSHNALEFYKTDENSITQPAYKFIIDEASYLGDSEDFINVNLNSKDTLSLQRNALKIYQDLLKFHRKNQSSIAYVDADIARLNFVQQHATFNDKEDLLLKALKTKAEQLKTSPLSALYNFEIATLYQNQGQRYNSNPNTNITDDADRWKLKDAVALCDLTITAFPKSRGAVNCAILKSKISQPQLNLQAEQYISTNAPSRLFVSYKNLKRLDFSIYKINNSQLNNFNSRYDSQEKENFFKDLKITERFSTTLKIENDYQQHSTELVLPNLTNGLYLIKADTNSETSVFAAAHIQVTNLALLESTENKHVSYQLINRNNGKPMVGASIKLSYTDNKNKTFAKNFTTDHFGKFQFKKDNNYYRNVAVIATYNNETAQFGDYYISRTYRDSKAKDTDYRTFLFTDRSIYRPGQTVYFKGISTEHKDGKSVVTSGNNVTAELYNANGEKLSDQRFVTNAFGSFNGEFVLPNNGLTGEFYILSFLKGIHSSYSYFSVEEYKRPKFKLEFQPVTDTHKVNDSITVNGTAVAFAGSNITNAKVVYHVKRQVQYPSWYYWRRPYINLNPQEITFGETKTNAKGEFDITFSAIPDETVSKESLPIFRYLVTADITDINGETRTATTSVNVGYHAMTLKISAPELIDTSKQEIELILTSKNLNGEFSPTKGTLKIYKLNAPASVLRVRPWQAPDYQVIPQKEFKTRFPHDAYNNEDALTNWKKGTEVFSMDFETEKDKIITLKKLKKWNSGKYIIVAESKDKFNQNVKDETFTSLFSTKDNTIADQQLFEAQLDKTSYKTGDIAKLTLGSAAKDLSVTVDIEKDNKIIVTQIITLNNSKETINIPVLKGDLGGFVVHCSFAAFNSYNAQSFKINVPYPKTDLDIETKTFRDKLQPGQDETWSFTIKGPKGDKVSAELLASMYDASLDEFKPHQWNFNPINRPSYYGQINKNARQSFGNTNFRLFNRFETSANYPQLNYDRLNWFGFYFGSNHYIMNKRFGGVEVTADMAANEYESLDEVVVVGYGTTKTKSLTGSAIAVRTTELDTLGNDIISKRSDIKSKQNSDNIQIRKNLNETAFFFPQLQTDAEGNVSFNFKAPEALTKWKLQLVAHTKTLESAVTQLEAVTQKELMVIPNAPRFLREGDKITISTKIANLTKNALSGVVRLLLTDPITGKSIDGELSNAYNDLNFEVNGKGNTQVAWTIEIPKGLRAVQYKVIAKAGNFSDGVQNALPVLSNRMLVTETLPMWIRSNETKTFTLDKLKNNTSTTLTNHKLTLEMTSNPAWYAVQALPYLMEYPYDCNEQTFSRYYANALAQHIVTSNPKNEAVFKQWKSSDALLSNLEKNQELKSILIEETPWLRDAQSESEQKKRIGLLFDLNKMNNELSSALRKLKSNQSSSGAWPWFKGGRDNRYITQHIIAGFGHLKTLNVISTERGDKESQMIQNAIQYLDTEFIKEYKDIKKYNKNADLSKDHLSHTQLHYLYVRSFYPEVTKSKEVDTIMTYYKDQIKKYWLKRSLYTKGLMTLSMQRLNEQTTATKILKSLKENSINSAELGMYWKANTNSWNWYQAPIETQALLIEAFAEVGSTMQNEAQNLIDIDNLKIWLLKHKQTNQWKTTKATTEAVYALLLQGSSWLDVTEMVAVKVGNNIISPTTLDNVKLEAGTGYYKTAWHGTEIKKEQADVTLTKNGDGIAWGALYWQYFEDLDKITLADTPLKLSKKLFLKTNTDKGEEISEITTDTKLNIGDLVRVRIELRTDRSMEFIHLKDMRAAGFEPINVISKYKWQDGLGYYESTKDAATNFFIDYLPKGIYVFEYDLRVNNAGNMSNGISTIQSMYAPEFSSHSEGVRILVD